MCLGKSEYFFAGAKEPYVDTCPSCNGTGRMIEETTVILKPYICTLQKQQNSI